MVNGPGTVILICRSVCARRKRTSSTSTGRVRLMRPVTLALSYVWGLVMAALALFPEASWAQPLAMVSLGFPVYYFVLSGINHTRVMRDEPEEDAA